MDAQLLRGFVEQVGKRFGRRDPYDYGGPAGGGDDGPTSLKESQAQIIQELWRARHGASVDRLERFTSTYVEDLQRLVDGAGSAPAPVAGRSRPRSTGSSRPSSTRRRPIRLTSIYPFPTASRPDAAGSPA